MLKCWACRTLVYPANRVEPTPDVVTCHRGSGLSKTQIQLEVKLARAKMVHFLINLFERHRIPSKILILFYTVACQTVELRHDKLHSFVCWWAADSRFQSPESTAVARGFCLLISLSCLSRSLSRCRSLSLFLSVALAPFNTFPYREERISNIFAKFRRLEP